MAALHHIDETPAPILHLTGMLSHRIGRPLQAERLNQPEFSWLIADKWMNSGDDIILMIMVHAVGNTDEWRYTSAMVGNGVPVIQHGKLQELVRELTVCN